MLVNVSLSASESDRVFYGLGLCLVLEVVDKMGGLFCYSVPL